MEKNPTSSKNKSPMTAAALHRVQRKIAIGSVNDPMENEARLMADHIMRMPEPGFIKNRFLTDNRDLNFVQRKPLDLLIQKEGSEHNSQANEFDSRQLDDTKGDGSPLETSTKVFMEQRFGTDFSDVKIHSGSDAVQMSGELNAQAFTYGSDIYFNSGKYNPETLAGKKRLAHELTHVIQQGTKSPALGRSLQRKKIISRDIIQRSPAETIANSEIKFRMYWLTDEGLPVENNEQIVTIAKLTIAILKDDLNDIDSASVKAEALNWISTVQGALPYFQNHLNEKVDSSMIPLINYQYDQLVEIRESMRIDKAIQIKEALWREHRAAIKAAEEAEALEPALNEALRAAYRKGNSSTIKEVVTTIKSSLSIGRNLRSLAADITKDIFNLPLAKGTSIHVDRWSSLIGRPKITIINVGKYTDKLAKLGRGLAALNILLTVADRSKKATEAEQGMKDFSDAFSIGTDLISVSSLSAPPHFGLYSTLYLKPAIKIISKQMSMLVENLSDVNQASVEVTGDLLYPNAEPGGQEMFNLMKKVMHAQNERDVPAFSKANKQYLYEHRDKLSAGAGSEIPTEGHWFWADLDGPAARNWLFANRKRVWAMFYGSMKVPN